MNITNLIDLLPDSVKVDTIDFQDVQLKSGQYAIRVLLDRLLTDQEKNEMSKSKRFIGIDCVACHRYAKEIKKSYFYVIC